MPKRAAEHGEHSDVHEHPTTAAHGLNIAQEHAVPGGNPRQQLLGAFALTLMFADAAVGLSP